jgi:hypothetical protein
LAFKGLGSNGFYGQHEAHGMDGDKERIIQDLTPRVYG